MFQSPPKRKSFLISVKSREQLLHEDEINSPDLKLRRTKIICSINDQTNNYTDIKGMVTSGGNALRYNSLFQKIRFFSVNAAYVKSRKELKKTAQIRDQLETELGKTIPLMLMLKGRVIRVGRLTKPELYLQVPNFFPL
jgi:pyruvate kinase